MKYFLLLFSFLFTLSVYAGGDADYSPDDEATHIPAMILVEDEDIDDAIDWLEELGVTVLRHRGNILLTLIPLEAEKDLSKRRAKGIRAIEITKPGYNVPTMNKARYFNDAYLINEGYTLPQPYDGKGVVVGVCDIGIDTRHPNFLNADGSECRIRRVVHYEEQQGRRTVYDTPETIYDWRSDNTDDWHATHVTGIAAGGYSAPLVSTIDGSVTDTGLQSLAPAADIVFTASQLSDVGLLAGVEDIIEYAKADGKPAVINLSMGNYTGPHDGTSLFSQYLDMCAEDAVICLSAGNEGIWQSDGVTSMTYDFTEDNRVYEVTTSDYGGTDYAGEAEVWSRDDTPFIFKFFFKCDTSTAGNLYPYEGIVAEDGEETVWRISVDPDDPDYDETFAAHFNEGYVQVTAGLSPFNNRYYANVRFELKTDETHGNQKWAEYWAATRVEAEPGTHIDICAGNGLRLRTIRGYSYPDNAMCISDLATGKKVVSVGAMNNTEVYSDSDEGEVSVFSSYGTLVDGRVMPLTVAPGAYVYSSISSAYLEKYPDDIQWTDYKAEINGETSYWIGDLGTSMSCPFVAGAIATWLQAYPQLTSEEVIEIIQRTNRKNEYPSPDDPRHGQGWFDAYASLQEALELCALKVGTTALPDATIKVEGSEVVIGNPSGGHMTISVYDMAGKIVTREVFSGTLGSVSLGSLPRGIYIVHAGNEALKIVI